MGNEMPLFESGVERKLLILRLQASHIHHGEKDLGAVLFSDTFFQLDVAQGLETSLNLTRNVPLIQVWQTTHKHYEHLPVPI